MSGAFIKFKNKGDFSKTGMYFKRLKKAIESNKLEKYAQRGVIALSNATPVDTGLTASSWYYTIEYSDDKITIRYHNSNIQNYVPIAVILQYGHATKNGGWVEGIDYINPAIQPVFKQLVEDIWKEVINT